MLTTSEGELPQRLPVIASDGPAGEQGFRWRFVPRLRRPARPQITMARSEAASAPGIAWSRYMPHAVALGVAVWLLTRINWAATPDGDPALHLKLIKDIAARRELPTELPNLAARIGSDGRIEAMFPYSYPPLYHLTGALFYAIGGTRGVMMINVLGAATIAFVLARFLGRRLPWYVATAGVASAWLSIHVQPVFAGEYMEPMMLGLFFAGAWFCYVALMTRKPKTAVCAGVLLGLSVATRQTAMFHVAVLACVVGLYLFERHAWSQRRRRVERRWIAAICITIALTAAPSLLYLAQVTGSLGYGDLTVPGMASKLAIDHGANAYIARITTPDMSFAGWLKKYEGILLYGDRWMPLWIAAVPLALFAIGSTWLHARGGAARFLARWALAQFGAEILLFLTLHGNSRYIILSQMLFYAMVPVGAYAVALAMLRWSAGDDRRRAIAGASIATVCGLALLAVAPSGYWSMYRQSPDSEVRAFRGHAYAEMGAWVNANTNEDAIILTPRTYTAELTWDRTVTWVTFYGNAWIIDAIGTPDPRLAHEILVAHGIDYVLIPAPPGTYVDQIPVGGMRSYLTLGQPDTPYFSLAHLTEEDEPLRIGKYTTVTNALRLYKVNDTEEATR